MSPEAFSDTIDNMLTIINKHSKRPGALQRLSPQGGVASAYGSAPPSAESIHKAINAVFHAAEITTAHNRQVRTCIRA